MKREIHGVTAKGEEAILVWFLPRMPRWVSPDMLTTIALAANIAAGCLYVLAPKHMWLLLVINALLVVNWFSDSLDGKLARYRKLIRPYFGQYIDHVCDCFGILAFCWGIAYSSLVRTPVFALVPALFTLIVLHIYYSKLQLRRYSLTLGPIGPTEMRVGVILVNTGVWIFGNPVYDLLNAQYSVYDLAGIALVGILLFWNIYVSISVGKTFLDLDARSMH